jgi:disulfide bond formation protein DsbB
MPPPFRPTPLRAAFVVLAASAAILGAALFAQYVGGLRPCELCHWQRYPYVATIVLGLLALLLARNAALGRYVGALIGLAGVVFLAGAGIAVFHIGVEQHWWQGTSACGQTLGQAQSIEDLRRALLAQPVVRCDQVAWSFLGLSMAGYNFLLSVALGLFSLAAAFRLLKDARL